MLCGLVAFVAVYKTIVFRGPSESVIGSLLSVENIEIFHSAPHVETLLARENGSAVIDKIVSVGLIKAAGGGLVWSDVSENTISRNIVVETPPGGAANPAPGHVPKFAGGGLGPQCIVPVVP